MTDELRPDPYLMRHMRQIMATRRPLGVEADHAIEPKLSTGGPQGNPDGPGRGALTPRQMERLRKYAAFVRKLDA